MTVPPRPGPPRDDLDRPVRRAQQVARVVSLVPSLTEAVAVTRPGALVGATDWCTHPADLDVPRVRGTKNPDVAAVVRLRPDLVIANKEENRRLDVERLEAAGVPVWVTVTETLDGALASMRRLFTDGLGWGVPGWLDRACEVWARPADRAPLPVGIPVWRDPWMVVGPHTFTADLAARLGLVAVAPAGTERYPHLTGPEQLVALGARCVLLPDEPYVFGADDGPEAFPGLPCALVSGRALTWYGPSLVGARAELEAALAAVVG